MKLRVGPVLAVLLAITVLTCAGGAFAQEDPSPRTDALSAESRAGQTKPAAAVQGDPAPDSPKKAGPFDLSINWRERTEGWDWFQGPTGDSNYPLWDSLLLVTIGQKRERLDWQVDMAQVMILGLPNDAVAPAPQGQLGLGGTYYAANGGQSNNAGAFPQQAFVRLKNLVPGVLQIGRFEYFDGLEVKPQDSTLAALEQTRVSQRLIANFGFSAVQRSFDGAQYSLNLGKDNLTFFAARPTEGVFQVDGWGELDVDIYSGAFTLPLKTAHSAGELRVFGMGYIDHRTLVLKTDNRPQAVRAADHGRIEIATYGADYLHVFNTGTAGKFDFLVWGALQGGAWGALTQRAGAFAGEAGWQPPLERLKPWLSAGYSYGSGDSNPNDGTHGTFFQLLPTPRLYARFPFYNMMNNEDFYGTLNVRPASKLSLRSEAHFLRLASAADLWYLGGGAFQPQTFGYTGRPSGGSRSLANVLDISGDYRITRNFSATLYYGHAWGKSVVASIYPNDRNGSLAFLETNWHF